MPTGLLRDKRHTTKLLILLEVTRDGHHSMSSLAEGLDITVQGVSDYIRMMVREGLVRKAKGGVKATNKGVLFMHRSFSDLREFVEDEMNRLNIIDLTTAIAGDRIKAGDRVGLFMEAGELMAYKGRHSPSMGMAITNAGKGEDVGIKELDGIVSMRLGRLTMLQVPSIQDGGSRALGTKSLRLISRASKGALVGAMGTSAKVLVKKAALHVDIRFSIPSAAVEACQKGHDVLLVVGQEHVHEVVSMVEAANSKTEGKIGYSIEVLETTGQTQ